MKKSNMKSEYELAGSAYDNIKSNLETKAKVTTKAIINLIMSIVAFIVGLNLINFDDFKSIGYGLFLFSAVALFISIKGFKNRKYTNDSADEAMTRYSHPIYGSVENIQSIIDETNATARYVDSSFVIGDKYLVDKSNLINIVELDKITDVLGGVQTDDFYYLKFYVDHKFVFETHYPMGKKAAAKLKEMQQYCPNAIFKI